MTARTATRTALERPHRIGGCYHALRWSAGLAAALAASACAGAAPFGSLPGVSNAPHGAADSARSSPPPRPRWPRFGEVLSWPPTTPAPMAVRGHDGGRYTALVRVSPAARNAYSHWTRGARMQPGTVIAMFQEIGQKPGPVYVMSKQPDDSWRFLVLDAAGRVSSESTALCRRCHAEAPSDDVFGPGESGKAAER